jgi:hypothetical protein
MSALVHTGGEHRGILDPRSPAGPPQTIVKSQGLRVSETVPGDDSQASGESDRGRRHARSWPPRSLAERA